MFKDSSVHQNFTKPKQLEVNFGWIIQVELLNWGKLSRVIQEMWTTTAEMTAMTSGSSVITLRIFERMPSGIIHNNVIVVIKDNDDDVTRSMTWVIEASLTCRVDTVEFETRWSSSLLLGSMRFAFYTLCHWVIMFVHFAVSWCAVIVPSLYRYTWTVP